MTQVDYDPVLAPVAQEGEDFDIEWPSDDAPPSAVATLGDEYLADPGHGTGGGMMGRLRALLRQVDVPGATPASRGWGQAGEHQRANCVKVTARGISVWMHKEVAVIYGHLMVDLDDHLQRRGKKDLSAQADDWGLAIRKVRGSKTVWSNHAWGLAADFNAIENPMTDRLVTTFDPKYIRALLKGKYRGLIRWGGDYSGRKDAMHFEFMGTPEQARLLTRDLRGSRKPTPPKPDPSHQHHRPAIAKGDKGHPDAVKDLIGHLNAAYRPYKDTIKPLPVSGVFSAAVEVRYRDWQRRTGRPVTGKVAGDDWVRLHQVTKNVRLDAGGRRF